MKRLSRSDSSMTVASRSAFSASLSPRRQVAQRACRSQHGRERRLEIVRDRGQQGRTQPIRLDRAFRPVHVLDQVDALDGERGLIDQGVEQTALIGSEKRAGLVAVDPHDADSAAAGPHRQEQALRSRERVRAAPGDPVVLPCPFRRRDIRLVEDVLGRIAGLDDNGAVLRQQQHDPHLQHQRGLVRRRPEDVIEGADPRQLAAERVEQFHRAHALARGHGLGASARGEMRDHDRHHGEEDEGGEIGRDR